MSTTTSLSKRITESLTARMETAQWTRLIDTLLRRLELNPADRADAEAEYRVLAEHLADKLSIPVTTCIYSLRVQCAHKRR